MKHSFEGIPLLQIKDLKFYFKFHSFERSKYLDQKFMEYLQYRPSFEPNPLEKKAREDYWSLGREKRIVDGEDYTYQQEEVLVKAVDGLNITVHENESISIIGETGSGKSSLLFSIMNFHLPHLSHKKGEINYISRNTKTPVNLLSLSEQQMEQYRGIHLGFIPQLPKESLNPWLKIGFQTGEVLFEKLSVRQEKIKERVLEFLGKVVLPDPKINYNKYVDKLSGGEAQRVCIAMALLADPRIILADEPLSALDTIIQANVIHLLLTLKKELKSSYVFATHNLGVAGQLGDTIAVMYGGEIVEVRSKEKFFEEPLHPYSKGLLNSAPWYAVKHGLELEEIPGELPKPHEWPSGCKFHPRCPSAMAMCQNKKPPRMQMNGSLIECFLYS
ncbi:peptide ABC transporter ATP-binding protein [Candidatus Heimdallarchaeota archaeon B3_Heim]|nr:MAG: peptide ABC transporter ATP-binding protein [Candidatus Heimdallarchaeota archaeon B3_Heim]